MSGVYGQIARYNPVTFMIDGLRYQVTVGFDAREAAIALGWAFALAVLGIAVATRAIKGRLSR
jgi:ABC-type polysaccharide/polyol phosphate export permease